MKSRRVPTARCPIATTATRAAGAAITSMLCGLIAAGTGCVAEPGAADPPGGGEPVGETREAFSDVGLERIIPLRFIECEPNSASDPFLVSPGTLQFNIDRANRTFGVAGVQFTIQNVERYAMPHFNVLDLGTSLDWSDVWQELHQVFPGVAANSWSSGESHTNQDWLHMVGSRFATDDYAPVFVSASGAFAHGGVPWESRVVTLRQFDFAAPAMPNGCSNGPAPGNTFSHELGHYLGLPHTFWSDTDYMWDLNPTANGAVNPETGQPIKLSDFWDLVYCPAFLCGTTKFYGSSAAAAADEANLRPIDQPVVGKWWTDSNCYSWNGIYYTSRAVCANCASGTKAAGGVVDSQYYTSANDAMKGVIFSYGDGRQEGVNVMSYWHDTEVGISASQRLQIQRTLRYDTPIRDQAKYPNLTGRRHLVGRQARRAPVYAIDFDGDGRRDLAVWQPPYLDDGSTGMFSVRLSGGGYTTWLSRSLGVIGDTPVPADYDGDGKTDFAVFHTDWSTAGGYSYWTICKSSTGWDCSAGKVQTVQWGAGEDIPLPGLDFDGDPKTGELTIFRPSIGQFAWYNLATSAWDYRNFGPGRIPLPGLYDYADTKTDLVTYDPYVAMFEMRLSGTSWNSVSTRWFPSGAAGSSVSGTQDQRSGAVAVSLMSDIPYYDGLEFKGYVKRNVLSLWDPTGTTDGLWSTMWRPTEAGATAAPACQWGASIDVPLGGFLDTDGDHYGDYLVYRASTKSTPGAFYALGGSAFCSGSWSSAGPWISGTIHSFTDNSQARPFIAGDMDGDGKNELGVYDQLQGAFYMLYSTEGYQSQHLWVVGGPGAVAL